MKPRQCAIVGYAPAGMCFNSVSTCHTSDTFHVCYEVTSVNTAEPRSVMRNGDQRNTGKLVDRGSVMERSVAGAAERSGIKKNKGKIAISSQVARVPARFRTVTTNLQTRSQIPTSNGMCNIDSYLSTKKLDLQKIKIK